MRFNELTVRVLVRENYRQCYDFYTEKIGLVATWGDRNGPYTSFSIKAGGAPCFAIFDGNNMSMFKGYEQPKTKTQSDTIVVVISSDNLDEDYKKLKAAGVDFLGEPQETKEWGMRCVYFRDPEGNLFELNDASTI